MTSSVKVAAHCANNKEVVVRVFNTETGVAIEEHVLQDGEATEIMIYDARAVTSNERVKAVE
jgi:hypothetical protein